jgi:hypothetical protein
MSRENNSDVPKITVDGEDIIVIEPDIVPTTSNLEVPDRGRNSSISSAQSAGLKNVYDELVKDQHASNSRNYAVLGGGLVMGLAALLVYTAVAAKAGFFSVGQLAGAVSGGVALGSAIGGLAEMQTHYLNEKGVGHGGSVRPKFDDVNLIEIGEGRTEAQVRRDIAKAIIKSVDENKHKKHSVTFAGFAGAVVMGMLAAAAYIAYSVPDHSFSAGDLGGGIAAAMTLSALAASFGEMNFGLLDRNGIGHRNIKGNTAKHLAEITDAIVTVSAQMDHRPPETDLLSGDIREEIISRDNSPRGSNDNQDRPLIEDEREGTNFVNQLTGRCADFFNCR